jgi:hypothetical protein
MAFREKGIADKALTDAVGHFASVVPDMFEAKGSQLNFRGGWESKKAPDMKKAYDNLSTNINKLAAYPGMQSDPDLKKKYTALLAAKAKIKNQYEVNKAAAMRTWEATVAEQKANIERGELMGNWAKTYGQTVGAMSRVSAENYLKSKGLPANRVAEFMQNVWPSMGPQHRASWMNWNGNYIRQSQESLKAAQSQPKPNYPALVG